MQLIGMLDSPYVRRVAISLQLLGLPFEHRSVSVFSTFEQFRQINPVVKAPTLVCDDGSVLMDSTLILDYAESLAGPDRSLMPRAGAERLRTLRTLRIIGLALAACEKSVQVIYEHKVRPAEKVHAPWLARVTGQLQAAWQGLEAELVRQPLPADRASRIQQDGVTTAVAWTFVQATVPQLAPAADFPALQAFAAQMEQRAEFAAAPHGDGTYRAAG